MVQTHSFVEWSRIAEHITNGSDSAIFTKARAMQDYRDKIVLDLSENATVREFAGSPDVPVVNVPGMFGSDVCHALLDRHPDAPFVVSYSERDGVRLYSLRSTDGRDDVSIVARKYGGGGHRNAAGFSVPL